MFFCIFIKHTAFQKSQYISAKPFLMLHAYAGLESG